MIPFWVLLIVTLALRLILGDWDQSLRGGLVAMFALTASAHWGKRRADLIRMVPPSFPRPDLIVTITGILEILGAIGLLIPATARLAAGCLALLLVAMFPANIHAAREKLSIGGRPATEIKLRFVLQIVFIGALIAVASGVLRKPTSSSNLAMRLPDACAQACAPAAAAYACRNCES